MTTTTETETMVRTQTLDDTRPLSKQIANRLAAGEDPAMIAEALSLDTTDEDEDYNVVGQRWRPKGAPVAVLLPGWSADDGNAEVVYPDADSDDEAAREYVDGGEWGERDTTTWIHVRTWRRGYVWDADEEEVVEVIADEQSHTVQLDPEEPECPSDEGEHDWQAPHELVGGLIENPGVHGHGGGVTITTVCMRCGARRVEDTWAQDPETGQQGLESVTYEPPGTVELPEDDEEDEDY
jgi:hypothetical protein